MSTLPPLETRIEPRIWLAVSARSAMAAAAAEAWPREACGLLLGRREQGALHIRIFRATANEAADPRSEYRLPPLELLAAHHEAKMLGLEVAGVWHSHPDAPATPSRRDSDAAWEGYSYGIEAVSREGAGELRFFAWGREGVFRDLPWRLAEEGNGGFP